MWRWMEERLWRESERREREHFQKERHMTEIESQMSSNMSFVNHRKSQHVRLVTCRATGDAQASSARRTGVLAFREEVFYVRVRRAFGAKLIVDGFNREGLFRPIGETSQSTKVNILIFPDPSRWSNSRFSPRHEGEFAPLDESLIHVESESLPGVHDTCR